MLLVHVRGRGGGAGSAQGRKGAHPNRFFFAVGALPARPARLAELRPDEYSLYELLKKNDLKSNFCYKKSALRTARRHGPRAVAPGGLSARSVLRSSATRPARAAVASAASRPPRRAETVATRRSPLPIDRSAAHCRASCRPTRTTSVTATPKRPGDWQAPASRRARASGRAKREASRRSCACVAAIFRSIRANLVDRCARRALCRFGPR